MGFYDARGAVADEMMADRATYVADRGCDVLACYGNKSGMLGMVTLELFAVTDHKGCQAIRLPHPV